MKKNITVLSAIILATALLVPAPAPAADMSVGAVTWYAWWDHDQKGVDNDYDPFPMFGPMLAFGFSKQWSVTAVMLFGRFHENRFNDDFDRFDSDIALNYGINRYIKVFGGAKVIYIDFESDTGYHRTASPALGIGITLPLGSSVFLLGNFSGTYGWGHERTLFPLGASLESDLIEKGYNASLTLAWYIDGISTTVSLGGRFQRVVATYDAELLPQAIHTFYGVTLSAVYSFGL